MTKQAKIYDARVLGRNLVRSFKIAALSAAVTCGTLLTSCVSLEKNGPTYTEITPKMDVEEMATLAISEGGPTLDKTRKAVATRQLGRQMETFVEKWLKKNHESCSTRDLVIALQLYQFVQPRHPQDIAALLVSNESIAKVQLGWQLAGNFPSKKMAIALDQILSRALLDNNESRYLLPEMAQAVAKNGMAQTYSYVREGLMRFGHEDFAQAMADLDPMQASEDFLTYLARAKVEDLRQIHVSAVNIVAATVMFRHFTKVPPKLSHPNFANLFFYAISMNSALNEMGREIISSYLPAQSETIALDLARLPVWVQVAYIESAKRNRQSQVSLMLSHLKEITDQQDVLDEIREFVE